MKHSLFLPDESALLSFASSLANAWQSQNHDEGLVVWLQGDLGAGKTTFARGFLHGLGYQGVVKSPTYTLVEPYQLESGLSCYHFDLYRLADPEELEFTGARDYFDGHSICLIEWPEKAAGWLPDPDIECSFVLKDKGRSARLESLTEPADQLVLGVIGDYLL